MPYKQPKRTPLHNHGASEPITAAILAGLKVVGTKVAGKVAAKAAAKAATKKAASKAAAKLATKTATKAAAKGTAKKTATKLGSKATKLGKKAGKLSEKATKLGEKSTKLTDKFSGNDVFQKSFEKSTSNIAEKTANRAQFKGNIAGQYSKAVGKATGKGGFLEGTGTGKILSGNTKALTQADKVDLGKKAFSGGQQVAGKFQEKQSSKPVADASSFTSSADTKTVTNSQGQQEVEVTGYSNPQGPSAYFNPKTGPSMRHGLKYDNVGPSMTKPVKSTSKTTSGEIKTNPAILESLNPKNIKTKQKAGGSMKDPLSPRNLKKPSQKSKIQKVGDYARDIDATVNIGGFRFNVGQMVDLGLRAGGAINSKVKSRKILKEQDKAYENKKQSAARAKEQKQMANVAKDIKIENLKG